MLLKYCPYPGCGKLIEVNQSYCSDHNRHKEYDRNIRKLRDKQYDDFYHSEEWKVTRKIIKSKYLGLCLWSYYHGDTNRIVNFKPVHHIIPLREDWERRIDMSNLVPLSQDAHAMVEEEYRNGNKVSMQKELFKLIERWNKEFGSG